MSSTASRTTGLKRPTHVIVAEFERYQEAKEFVQQLQLQGVGADQVSIVADALEPDAYEGRSGASFLRMLSALPRGILLGAALGFSFALIFLLGPPPNDFARLLYHTLMGGLTGGLVLLLNHVSGNRERMFSARNGLSSRFFSVVVDTEVAELADAVAKEKKVKRFGFFGR